MPESIEISKIITDNYNNRQSTIGPVAKDADAIMREIDNTPLFMQYLPKDAEDHDVLNAIQALIYDGEPEGKRYI